ncbi:MAG: GntR family transcriptional regulator [Solirubrobacterales bacterium]|nr:GntR family transcriptional regulator [Solirubrobacterales bacterium]
MSPLPTLPVLTERRTASDEVADTLRDAITMGQFEDGEELNQVELAKHFGVSRVPVREALRRLQAEGLVSAEAHRRVVVPGLNRDRISEIFEVRALLESYLLGRSAPHLDAERLASLRAICDSMDKARGRDAWLARNHDFHRGLLAPADGPLTVAIVERLSHQVERYLRRTGGVHRPKEAGPEHRAVLDALEDGDVERASKVLRDHILSTRDSVVAALPDDHPE